MGILFKPYLIEAIKAGRKHQTRRLWKDGYSADLDVKANAIVSISTDGQNRQILKWKVGKDYAIVPGRGQKGVGRVLITAIRLEALEQISEEDARDEGFENKQAFLAAFLSINGERADLLKSMVVVLEFKLLGVEHHG